MEHLLKIEGLDISFNETARALRGIDLFMDTGQIHGLVGESGSGKTVTSTCIIGLLPVPPGKINGGSMIFKGRELLGLNEAQRRSLRGREIAMIFQEPARYLNPALRVGEQITEMLILHQGLEKQQAAEKALELVDLVGLKGGKKILRRYPHELSGGMKQRAMIAMAISCDPSLLIADEPTTALDVTLQQQILKLIQDLKQRFDMGILFISHDLAVVHEIADRISVIYAGRIVESTTKKRLFEEPLHPYTRLLLLSIPDAEKRGTRFGLSPVRFRMRSTSPRAVPFIPAVPWPKRSADTRIRKPRTTGRTAKGTPQPVI